MRLGGPVSDNTTPDGWVAAVRGCGFRAAYCPVPVGSPDAVVHSFMQAAKQADIVIAEVGAWSNPLSPSPKERS
ncbi:MAG: hypothetical protein H7145_17440 [Akkermansiaceae bacterium]|nr:hypothetical protein [Armatimonadota bacterium]